MLSSWLDMNKENVKTLGFVAGILSGNWQAHNIGSKLDDFTKAVITLQQQQKTNEKDIKRVESKTDKNTVWIIDLIKKQK